jgi:rhamnogalacturonyl hydrolase YesR
LIKGNSLENNIESALLFAKSSNYSSGDISDLYHTKYYHLVKSLPTKLSKAASFPYALLLNKKPSWIRALIDNKPKKYPQGIAMVIRGLVALYKKNHALGDLDEAVKLGNWLIENKSPLSIHAGWGQPFDWQSRSLVFPKNLPRATVTSQVMHALLDLFDVTNNQEFLDTAVDAAYLFKNEFNYSSDTNGNHCISYTTLDQYHIHNASMLAAGAIIRAMSYQRNNELIDFAMKAAKFTASHQNDDGSFYYWAPPDQLNYMIDNYHTGFVLEGFWNVIKYGDDQEFKKVYDVGMKYYYEELFTDNIPKLTKHKTYPIDIQSCAQSIISFSVDVENKRYFRLAHEVAQFTNENMFLNKNSHFAYKLFEIGRLDESYYIRWGDAWMIRALALII